MPETRYVLCKHGQRWWPAKVLSRSQTSGGRSTSSQRPSMRVKIMRLNKQADVHLADVKPLTEENIGEIASNLDRAEPPCTPTKELTYRWALREALDILEGLTLSTPSTPSKNRAPVSPRGLPPSRRDLPRRGGGVSEAQMAALPREEGNPLPEAGPERRWRGPPKEEARPARSGSGRKRLTPSPAPGPHTSTPVSASSRPRRALPVSPPGGFAEGGASPARGGSPVLNGSRPLGGSRGVSEEGAGSSPARKRRRRLGLENSNPEPGPSEGAAVEGRREEEETGRPAEARQEETSEEEGGWASASDLSLRLSPIREGSSREEEEEDELPSLLPPQEPGSIEAGKLVWCKLPRYPYWPAVVRKVKRKARKASVFLVEKAMEEKSKGFSISLRKLKPFDCQEKQNLIDAAREDYGLEINWCINLIEDYRIRVGCCSFRGSFLEYCADAMSYPVRREAPANLSQLRFPQAEEGDSRGSLSDTPPAQRSRKILPDRMRASRDRANGRIVDFIVKARGADRHLGAVLKKERPSRWLARFLQARPYLSSIETYLEDETQQDRVFRHLQEVYRQLGTAASPLVNGDRVRFILDVLFPEAIICAISAIDRIDYKKAEEKYLKGPLVTQREREIFEEEILEQKRKQQTEALSREDHA